MDLARTNAFQQLQILTMLTLVLFMAPAAMPPLRRHGAKLRLGLLVLYFGGGALILLNWWLRA